MLSGTVTVGLAVSARPVPPVALTSTLSTPTSSVDELILATSLTLKSLTRYDERLRDSWCHAPSSPEPCVHDHIVDHAPPLCAWTLRYSPESSVQSTNRESVSVAPVYAERSTGLASVRVQPVSQLSAFATPLDVPDVRVPSGL